MALKLIRMDAGTHECQILSYLQCFLIAKDNITHPEHNHHWQTPHQLNPMKQDKCYRKDYMADQPATNGVVGWAEPSDPGVTQSDGPEEYESTST